MYRFKRTSYLFGILTIALCLLLVPGNVSAQEIKATAAIDSTILPIGQQTKLHIEVQQPQDVVLNLPVFSDTIIDKIEILEQSDWDSVLGANLQLILKKDFLVTSFDSGFYFIPPFQFEVENGGGFIESNALMLKVITFDVDTTKGVFDIKTVKDVPYTFGELVPWLIGAGLVILLALLIIYLIKKVKRKEPIFQKREKPKEPAHIIALRELDALRESKLWQTDRLKEYYTKLTDVVRQYIEGRYNIPAMEQISDEILGALKAVDQEMGSSQASLSQILHTADLVKFAKYKPLPDENDMSLMNAYLFINQTKIEVLKSLTEVRDELVSEESIHQKKEA